MSSRTDDGAKSVRLGRSLFRVTLAGFLVSVLPMLGAEAVTPAAAEADPASVAVIAINDSGINPYHVAFRDDSARATQHPSTYLRGFPSDAIALPISLDASSYAEAVTKDCALWQSVQPGKLYWFPGTKIVAAMSDPAWYDNLYDDAQDAIFGALDSPHCPGALILDTWAHGTATASRAASNVSGACPDCLLTVMQAGPIVRAIEALAAMPWIDVQSNSWNWMSGYSVAATPAETRTIEAIARRQLVFFASGNGATGFGGAPGVSYLQPGQTPSAIRVGGHDNGHFVGYPNVPPHVVADVCGTPVAAANSLEGSVPFGGTSASAPFAAGGAARLALTARQILGDGDSGVRSGIVAEGEEEAQITQGPLSDGAFSITEWRAALLRSATARPVEQVEDGNLCEETFAWRELQEGFPSYVSVGYGAVDRASLSLAQQVLRGDAPIPDRSQEESFFAAYDGAGSVLHETYSSLP